MPHVVPDHDHCLTSSTLPNFAVWIEIDGQAVSIHSKKESNDRKSITGYIEAKEGQKFVVHFADLRTSLPQHSYSARLYIDGDQLVDITTSILFWMGTNDVSRFVSMSGKEINATQEQPFSFGKLRLTDDDDTACHDEHALKNLGTIKLMYRRIKNVRNCQAGNYNSSTQPKSFHEKAKKAQLSHQATFGAPVAKLQGGRSSFDWMDDEDHPLQTYEFRYRSRQLLQLEGLVPGEFYHRHRSSSLGSPPTCVDSPVPSPRSSPSPEVLNPQARDAEIARLQRQIDALKKGSTSASPGPSGTRKVKAEDEAGVEKKRVKKEKQEDSSSDVGKGKGKEKEVIVLSDSD
ncbi:hypothetical protein JCM5353_004749 [Sporobolomyces roseus]